MWAVHDPGSRLPFLHLSHISSMLHLSYLSPISVFIARGSYSLSTYAAMQSKPTSSGSVIVALMTSPAREALRRKAVRLCEMKDVGSGASLHLSVPRHAQSSEFRVYSSLLQQTD
jgi:hypothetical protein